HQTFDSNGPDIRVRGTAFQVLEKYLALARDATTSGDRIAAENFYQHAEHYYRIINANGEANQLVAATPRDTQDVSGGEDSDSPESLPESPLAALSGAGPEASFGGGMPRRPKPEPRPVDNRAVEPSPPIVDLSTVEQPDILPGMMLESGVMESGHLDAREPRPTDPQPMARTRRSHLGYGQRITRSPYQKGPSGFSRPSSDTPEAAPEAESPAASAEAPVVRRRSRRDLFGGGTAAEGREALDYRRPRGAADSDEPGE
ncbi:MAG: DUF4167 domain-containing protein, partial [Alphaproteobacteria bacterium]|nr:DUF4167 domain-containing protein [Alphaproteobacteria bacterium]